jgi:hypothetical protein
MRTPSRRPGLDRPGESHLKRLDWFTCLQAVPGQVAALRTKVPDTHVHFEQGVGSVTCTCAAGLPLIIAPAQSAACVCGRIFVNIGRDEIRVCRPEETA